MTPAPDILLVSPGVTAGWRVADRSLIEGLEACGASVELARPDYHVAKHLRKGVLLTDLAEASALRRATDKATRQFAPRAFILSSVQAAMLQPRSRVERSAIRFDAPPSLNRRGRGATVLHRLERRARIAAKLELTYGVAEPSPASVPLPVPLRPIEGGQDRQPIAVVYAGNPEKKGLDTIVSAWEKSSPPRMRLVVTGIEPAAARAFLADRGITEPAGVEWAGLLEAGEFAALLTRAVLYVSASRFEDYGQAQLEALASGCLLVTTPSNGPYEALGIARRLDTALVSDNLVSALDAFGRTDQVQRAAYRSRARELLAAYSQDELERRLRERVLPQLLG